MSAREDYPAEAAVGTDDDLVIGGGLYSEAMNEIDELRGRLAGRAPGVGIGPGPHRGTLVVYGAAGLDDAVRQAAMQLNEYTDGRPVHLSTSAEPLAVRSGAGRSEIVGWDVTVDWQVVQR